MISLEQRQEKLNQVNEILSNFNIGSPCKLKTIVSPYDTRLDMMQALEEGGVTPIYLVASLSSDLRVSRLLSHSSYHFVEASFYPANFNTKFYISLTKKEVIPMHNVSDLQNMTVAELEKLQADLETQLSELNKYKEGTKVLVLNPLFIGQDYFDDEDLMDGAPHYWILEQLATIGQVGTIASSINSLDSYISVDFVTKSGTKYTYSYKYTDLMIVD